MTKSNMSPNRDLVQNGCYSGMKRLCVVMETWQSRFNVAAWIHYLLHKSSPLEIHCRFNTAVSTSVHFNILHVNSLSFTLSEEGKQELAVKIAFISKDRILCCYSIKQTCQTSVRICCFSLLSITVN